MNKTFNLLFFIKKNKIRTNGTAPVYLRITIDGKAADIAAKRYIDPQEWGCKAHKAVGNSQEARMFNVYLKTLEQQVFGWLNRQKEVTRMREKVLMIIPRLADEKLLRKCRL
jgi:hypothetical protein